MKQPLNRNQNTSSSKIQIIVVSLFLVILLIILGILVGRLLRQSGFQFSLPSLQAQATPTSSPASLASVPPTVVIPATGCGSPTLVLGTTTFQIQNLAPSADGSLSVPADTSGIAYWIQVSNANPVFVLSPTLQNIAAMSSISVGSAAKVTWADCSSVTYSLSAPQAGSLDGSAFAGQPTEITVFFPTASSDSGFVFKGKQITEPALALNPPTPVVENTLPAAENTTVPLIVPSATAESIIPTSTSSIPTPDYNEALAEIGVLDTSSSGLFGTNLKIEISVYNFGTLPFTLSESNVTLTQPDGKSLALKSSNPELPEEIQPGETKTIELNFEMPSSPTATLKILTVEYDIEGY